MSTWGGGLFRAKLSDFGINFVARKYLYPNISIIPNPISNILNIHFDNELIFSLSIIRIYSIFGNEIQLEPKIRTESNIELDVSELPQGVYFVNMMIGDKVERMNFVKIEN